MKCEHENADHLGPGDILAAATVERRADGTGLAACEQFRCLDCGAWLSLGPANDADPNVAVEIRAAEIAADLERHNRCLMSATEQGGFLDMPLPMRGGGTIDLTGTNGARAGYLAAAIVNHATHDTRDDEGGVG